jgi:hypothetical protein
MQASTLPLIIIIAVTLARTRGGHQKELHETKRKKLEKMRKKKRKEKITPGCLFYCY